MFLQTSYNFIPIIFNLINRIIGEYLLVFFFFAIGLYFTIRFRLPQIRIFFGKTDFSYGKGIHPFFLFFHSLGNLIGVGNICFMTKTVLSGGVFTLLFFWIGIFFGIGLKYVEIYMSIQNRFLDKNLNLIGGTSFLVRKYLGSKLLTFLSFFCFLICTIEIYQFKSILQIIKQGFNFQYNILLPICLSLFIVFSSRKIETIAKISSFLMPIFLIVYISSLFIILSKAFALNELKLLSLKQLILFKPLGNNNSSILFSMYQGFLSTVYCCDVGMGSESFVQVETSASNPKLQAKLCVFSLIINGIICTITGLFVLIMRHVVFTDNKTEINIMFDLFTRFIPYGNFVFFLIIFIAAYTTLCSYNSSGQKTVYYFSKKAHKFYGFLSIFFLTICSYMNIDFIRSVIMFSSTIVVLINFLLFFVCRNQIKI